MSFSSLKGINTLMSKGQAFTNCMHSYDYAHSVHKNVVTLAQKFVHCIDWEHNWKLLIACPHRPLCFKKIRTTTTTMFLIFNTIVFNPYSHSIEFDPQSFAPLPYLSQSDIQILYGFQIDNGIWQFVNNSWTGIF